jgi:hypothetical protein
MLKFEIIPSFSPFLRFRVGWRIFTFIIFRISKYFGLTITDETLVVAMHIWCIKISIVLVLHSNSLNRTLCSENIGLVPKSFLRVY